MFRVPAGSLQACWPWNPGTWTRRSPGARWTIPRGTALSLSLSAWSLDTPAGVAQVPEMPTRMATQSHGPCDGAPAARVLAGSSALTPSCLRMSCIADPVLRDPRSPRRDLCQHLLNTELHSLGIAGCTDPNRTATGRRTCPPADNGAILSLCVPCAATKEPAIRSGSSPASIESADGSDLP